MRPSRTRIHRSSVRRSFCARSGPRTSTRRYELGQDPATALWVPPLPADDGAGVVEYFEECRETAAARIWSSPTASATAYLGEVMVVLGEHRVGELGCGLVPAARGRGVATEAFGCSPEWAFDTLGLGRLQVFVATANVAALRLAEQPVSPRGCTPGLLGRGR